MRGLGFLGLDFLFLHEAYTDCHNNCKNKKISGNHLAVCLESGNNHNYTADDSKYGSNKSLESLEFFVHHHFEEYGDIERINCNNRKFCGVKCKHTELIAEAAEL